MQKLVFGLLLLCSLFIPARTALAQSGEPSGDAIVVYIIDVSNIATCTISQNGAAAKMFTCPSGSARLSVTSTYAQAKAKGITQYVLVTGNLVADQQAVAQLFDRTTKQPARAITTQACSPGLYVIGVSGAFSGSPTRRVEYQTRYNRGNTCIVTDVTDRSKKQEPFWSDTLTWNWTRNNNGQVNRNITVPSTPIGAWTPYYTVPNSTTGQTYRALYSLSVFTTLQLSGTYI